MVVHPIDYRYGTEEMKEVWEEGSRLEKMLKVEIALVHSLEKLDKAPEGTTEIVEKAAKKVELDRVKEIESEIKHDVMAVVRAIEEKCEDGAGEFVHFGATSNDIIDTADALRLRDSCSILEDKLKKLRRELAKKAEKHKETVCAGRTHGQAGVPTTWGHRFARWADEIDRHIERLEEIKKRILVGKMSGAVGTGASFGEKSKEVEKITMDQLDLGVSRISSQIIDRDRHAEYVFLLASIATSLDKITINIRNMQRTEISEVEEGFGEKQVGSSTMPHKRNPIKSENVGGLSRVVRNLVNVELRNNTLWEERDLTNSSSERVVFSEINVLTDHVLSQTIDIIKNLKVDKSKSLENIENLGGLNMAESVMMYLAKNGMGRQTAHEEVRRSAMEAQEKNKEFKEALSENRKIMKYLNEEKIEKLLKPEKYLGNSVEKVEDIVKEIK